MKITFISGRAPELTIKDDNDNIIEVIDLSKYSTDELHDLMIKKGFERKLVGAKSEI